MDLRIGCAGSPIEEERYYETFKVVELERNFLESSGSDKLKYWRATVPRDFEFVIRIGDITKDLFGSSGARSRLAEAAQLLKSEIMVFGLPSSFGFSIENKGKVKEFFGSPELRERRYKFVVEIQSDWPKREIESLCKELELTHSVDPFRERSQGGSFRFYRMTSPRRGPTHKYTGWDLKQLKDFCENESQGLSGRKIYTIFTGSHMLDDALRFNWIVKNTGRIREMDLSLFSDLCREIEMNEECEKAALLSREAEKIVSLILYTDYPKVDIEIEASKLRDMCVKLFPDKEYLYDMIYRNRFERIWEQFREGKRMEEGI